MVDSKAIQYLSLHVLYNTHNMFDLDVLLEYLKVLIWPIMIVYVVETFRRQIAQFINRLSKAQLPGGFVFDAEKQKTQEI